MLNWLKSLWNDATSGIEDLWRKVLSIFQAVYSYIDNWINQVVGWLNTLWLDFYQFTQSVGQWVDNVLQSLQDWVIRIYGDVEQWVSGLFSQLYDYVVSVYHWALQQLDNLFNAIRYVWSSIVNWVLTNIWDPLYNFIDGVFQWIGTAGYWMYYLLTHPDRLAQLLGQYLLREWINLSKKYAGVVGRWMIHTMLSVSNDVGEILASFLASIL